MHGFKYCFLKLGFFNWTGPTAEGKAVGLFLKLEVDLRRKSPEHAMHPLQGAADLSLSGCGPRPLAESLPHSTNRTYCQTSLEGHEKLRDIKGNAGLFQNYVLGTRLSRRKYIIGLFIFTVSNACDYY